MKNALLKNALYLLLAVVTVLALASPLRAQQQTASKAGTNPLVRLLESKGILTEEEAATVNQAASAAEADQRLARLLLSKGLITQEDYNQTIGASVVPAVAEGSGGARVMPAVLRVPVASAGGMANSAPTPAPQAKAPPVVPGIAPIRVFPVDPPKREGLIPAFKLGPVKVTPYGFFKASVVQDSSSPFGNDFPIPGLRGDTGPDASPEARVKARAMRVGSNFEWPDASPKITLTGRLEFDFEGDYTRVANRNVSSIRSSQPTIRLAWARLDYAATDKTTIFGLFGQDWTPFGSSTLPSIFESTGTCIYFGCLWERAPQARFGFNYKIGGSRNVRIQPEVAVVLPAYGNTPSDVANQLAFGERQGTDSGRPEVQGRVALQFQLDTAPGVAPAQLIVSGMQGERQATVLAAAIPAAFKGPGSPFTKGAQANSSRYGFTGEVQLPTRYATLIAKYYNGEDLKYYFGGQLLSHYNDTLGFAVVASAPSIDGSDTVFFGCAVPLVLGVCPAGQASVAPQRPVRAQGGFASLGFPLSRIANADPAGHNAGWQLYFTYGIDYAKARDVRRISTTGGPTKSDFGAVTIQYKLNTWASFVVEESYYRSRAIKGSTIGGAPIPLPLFKGVPAQSWHDIRSEIGTIFTF